MEETTAFTWAEREREGMDKDSRCMIIYWIASNSRAGAEVKTKHSNTKSVGVMLTCKTLQAHVTDCEIDKNKFAQKNATSLFCAAEFLEE